MDGEKLEVKGNREEVGSAYEYQKLQAEIRGYLIGATVLNISVCDLLASDISAMAMKIRERIEFAEILLQLKQRGVISAADAARWAEAEVANA